MQHPRRWPTRPRPPPQLQRPDRRRIRRAARLARAASIRNTSSSPAVAQTPAFPIATSGPAGDLSRRYRGHRRGGRVTLRAGIHLHGPKPAPPIAHTAHRRRRGDLRKPDALGRGRHARCRVNLRPMPPASSSTLIVSAVASATQIDRSANAISDAARPRTRARASERRPRLVPSPVLSVQTAPPRATMVVGVVPTGIEETTGIMAGSTTRRSSSIRPQGRHPDPLRHRALRAR
jgi:hypothetical protein